MFRSLRTQLTVPIIAALAVLGLLAWVLLERQISNRLTEEFDHALAARAAVLQTFTEFEEADPEEGEPAPFLEFEFDVEDFPEYAAAGADAGLPADEDEAEAEVEEDDEEEDEDLRHAIPADEPAWFQLWRNDDELTRSPNLGRRDLARLDVEPGSARFEDVELPDGGPGRLVTVRFHPGLDEEWGEVHGKRLGNLRSRYPGMDYPLMTLSVAVPRDSLDSTLGFIGWLLAGGLASLMVVVSVLAAWSTRRGLDPLNRLVAQLDTVDSEKLDGRFESDPLPLELKPVAKTLNTLMARLNDAFHKERLFTRNIAHELRTPIAELKSIGDVGARWPDDAETNRRFFEDLGRISDRMELIVSNLLTMARQESGQSRCSWEELDLAERLERVCDRFAGECRERGLSIECRIDAPIMIHADRGNLEMILNNLVANAVFHGGHDGPIVVEAQARGRDVALRVENAADGLDDDDLAHLFDRFWRKDPTGDTQHVGLGLPLVAALASNCGWTLEASLEDGGRFRVEVGAIRRAEDRPGVKMDMGRKLDGANPA